MLSNLLLKITYSGKPLQASLHVNRQWAADSKHASNFCPIATMKRPVLWPPCVLCYDLRHLLKCCGFTDSLSSGWLSPGISLSF